MIWNYVKAYRFLKDYCPQIRNAAHKLRGTSGDGKPITFTVEDRRMIRDGLKRLVRDLIAKIDPDQ